MNEDCDVSLILYNICSPSPPFSPFPRTKKQTNKTKQTKTLQMLSFPQKFGNLRISCVTIIWLVFAHGVIHLLIDYTLFQHRPLPLQLME